MLGKIDDRCRHDAQIGHSPIAFREAANEFGLERFRACAQVSADNNALSLTHHRGDAAAELSEQLRVEFRSNNAANIARLEYGHCYSTPRLAHSA